MYTDPVLQEKWRVQKKLSQKVNYDVKKLIKNAHQCVLEIAKEMNIELKYAKRQGGYLTTEIKTEFSEMQPL